ncbi:hypothetical protein Slin14017_G127670 [Septoria linicola]|nr:hypothetical protein Slin14017_G127670 [Septoria linicola]
MASASLEPSKSEPATTNPCVESWKQGIRNDTKKMRMAFLTHLRRYHTSAHDYFCSASIPKQLSCLDSEDCALAHEHFGPVATKCLGDAAFPEKSGAADCCNQIHEMLESAFEPSADIEALVQELRDCTQRRKEELDCVQASVAAVCAASSKASGDRTAETQPRSTRANSLALRCRSSSATEQSPKPSDAAALRPVAAGRILKTKYLAPNRPTRHDLRRTKQRAQQYLHLARLDLDAKLAAAHRRPRRKSAVPPISAAQAFARGQQRRVGERKEWREFGHTLPKYSPRLSMNQQSYGRWLERRGYRRSLARPQGGRCLWSRHFDAKPFIAPGRHRCEDPTKLSMIGLGGEGRSGSGLRTVAHAMS